MSYLDQETVGLEGRRLQEILPRPVSDGRRTVILDSPERGLSVQPDRRALLPEIKSNIDLQRNKIQLYCNQVYVTDSVEGIVPDFLTLLHGVIDSPDIPLNVSRSYLQSDSNVKKISTYITKKVSDRLQSIFKNDRKEFENKWDDLKIFINYGMLTQEDFYEKASKFALFKDTDNKYYTFEEYQTLIKDNQTDKNGSLIYLYANNLDEQYTYIDAAKNKGYNVLLMDGQLDVPMINMLEQKFERVTSPVWIATS